MEKTSDNQQAVVDPLGAEGFQLGPWQVFPSLGLLVHGGQRIRLEPKVMSLLEHLAQAAPQPLSREQLMAALWPQQIVGDDALARCVLKLRRALADDARAPTYLETIPKRGYRLLQSPASLTELSAVSRPDLRAVHGPGQQLEAPQQRPVEDALQPIWPGWQVALLSGLSVLLALAFLWQDVRVVQGVLGTVARQSSGQGMAGFAAWSAAEPIPTDPQLALQRADDYYYQFERQTNEAAAQLYQSLLEQQDSLPAATVAAAKAGLASVLVQRVIRWPTGAPEVPREQQSLSAARAQGRTASPWARASLDQARQLVADALLLAQQAPPLARARIEKTAGLIAALEGRLDEAEAHYLAALMLVPDLWEARLNLGEVAQMQGQLDRALQSYQQAYTSMKAQYFEQPQRIGPWLAALGVLIAELAQQQGAAQVAVQWYREVLSIAPLHPQATAGLAAELHRRGETGQARDLCAELILRIGPNKECQAFMPARRRPERP